MHEEPSQELPLRLSAMALALASTACMVWLLLRSTPPPVPAPDLQLVWIERIAPPQAEPEPEPAAEPAPAPERTQRPASRERSPAPARRASASAVAAIAPPQPASPTSRNAPGQTPGTRLYTAEGRLALAPNPEFDPLKRKTYIPGSEDDPKVAQVRNAFERDNPLPSQGGGFGGWASDGTLGEAFIENAGKRLQKIVDKMPWRKDIQSASARPPPPVRFNPALHERPSDLGSEATGDAYKAAPIAFERAPGLRGEASARIRRAIGELEARRRSCGLERLAQWLLPALAGLDELERIERAYASGVDPVRAEQLLPRSADMAYDRARRSIWYADHKGESCAPA